MDLLTKALTCKICHTVFADDKSFNKHLKQHSLLVVEYWQQQYPRYDQYDNSIIKFRNKEQYLTQEFNNKNNLKHWLEAQPKEVAKVYCSQILINRKNTKGILTSPSQVELRSLVSPSIIYFDELFKDNGGYYKLCESLGLENRFSAIDESMFTKPHKINNFDKYKIIQDTREQKPLDFSFATEVGTLKFGDYAFSHSGHSGNCYFERKSMSDLIGTLSSGYERFCREIERAQAALGYLIIIVEEDLNNALSFNTLPHVYKTKVSPDYIFHNVRKLCQKYKHIQFLFVRGRTESSRVIEKVFISSGLHQNFDLQLAYDRKLL